MIKRLRWNENLKLNREGMVSLLRKFLIAGGITLLFLILATLPQMGYFGDAHVHVRERNQFGFVLVDADCNVSFNPFLYSLSWMSGRGQYSVSFSLISVPTYVGGGDFRYPVWKSQSELEDEAIITLILHEIPLNVICSFFILLTIELMKMRQLYISLASGIVGFPFGGPIGSFIAFFFGLVLAFWLLPKLRKKGKLKVIDKIWGTEKTTESKTRNFMSSPRSCHFRPSRVTIYYSEY